ncbi:MAG: VOC family protein [Actinomycetota bacterium]|nr:VOC family protein [Actinomycetota bacterium]
MTYPNTLIFVDFPSDDPEASAEFYTAVFGWEIEGRPAGVFHRIVPGQNFQLDDGSQGPTGNLHMGIYNVANARPHPDPKGTDPRTLARDGRSVRVFILVSEDDSQERILAEAEKRGATILWRDHFWAEFNGFNSAFEDPWGNTLILWTKGGDDPQIPEGWTNE